MLKIYTDVGYLTNELSKLFIQFTVNMLAKSRVSYILNTNLKK